MITSASASGKVILFGEHAVVYGQPAIAAPVTQVAATATVEDRPAGPAVLQAPDIGLAADLESLPADDPLAAAARLIAAAAGQDPFPPLTLTVRSTIPIASGLGSGAATAAALIRALAGHWDRPDLAAPAAVSALAYEVEKLHHGTPSGIDNTVVSYGQPVYFRRAQPANVIETIAVGAATHLLVADTGIASPTRLAVADVRRAWEAAPERFDALFAACGRIADAARAALAAGDQAGLGALMNENQGYLEAMTVSSPELERLVLAARAAGALGAKLSGGGRGGNMIALVTPATAAGVRSALLAAGAQGVIASVLQPGGQ